MVHPSSRFIELQGVVTGCLRMQLKRYLARYSIRISSAKDQIHAADSIRKCILSGYFPNVARMQPDGTYRLVKGDIVEPELM